MPTYSFHLYSYYYANGVFDIPANLAALVRPDEGPVSLLIGDDRTNIEGQVTRFFNRHYQIRLPRILGGEKLRAWFQFEYQIDDQVDINLISFETIHLKGNPLSKELRQKDLSGLIEMFLGYMLERDWLDDTTVTPALIREIVRRGTPAVEPLLSLVTHSDWAVRHDTIRMLGYLRDKRAVEPLLIAMVKDESQAVQETAIKALERIGTPRALALITGYQNFLRGQRKAP